MSPQPALHFPRLGVGAMTWGHHSFLAYGGADNPDEERRAFEASVAGGATLIDTAEFYGFGRSEVRVGELARGSGEIVATKFLPLPWRGARDLPRMLASSLARLGRSSVDLYQIHFPVPWMSIRDLAARLADVVAAGKAKAVGVSNYSARQMRITHQALAERGVALASNQVHYSLLHRAPETNGVLASCRELVVALIAYCPLERGLLTGKYTPDSRPAGTRRLGRGFGRGDLAAIAPLLDLLRDIAARHGRTPAQVALRWLVEQDGVVPIPGAKNGRQAAENAGALAFSLEPGDVAALAAATRG
jgi:aryl-alcohol dehydrogenase-like predicted oxidoreductase